MPPTGLTQQVDRFVQCGPPAGIADVVGYVLKSSHDAEVDPFLLSH